MKIPIGAWPQTCSAMAKIIWRQDLRNRNDSDSSDHVVTCRKNHQLSRMSGMHSVVRVQDIHKS